MDVRFAQRGGIGNLRQQRLHQLLQGVWHDLCRTRLSRSGLRHDSSSGVSATGGHGSARGQLCPGGMLVRSDLRLPVIVLGPVAALGSLRR